MEFYPLSFYPVRAANAASAGRVWGFGFPAVRDVPPYGMALRLVGTLALQCGGWRGCVLEGECPHEPPSALCAEVGVGWRWSCVCCWRVSAE